MLNILNKIPENLTDTAASMLYKVLPGPTLIHLEGKKDDCLFVSVLLHGNETTGWDAVRALLQKYKGKSLYRGLSLFIGNIDAARHNRRFIEGQQDYNRIWTAGNTEGHKLAESVINEMQNKEIFLSIDIHNTTGKNPHYACLNTLENQSLHAATFFSRTVVYFMTPSGVQSMAFSDLCPAITIECGQSVYQSGAEHAREFLETMLHLEHLSEENLSDKEIDLYHTRAVVKIPEGIEFGYDSNFHQLTLEEELERLNFSELDEDTPFATFHEGKGMPFDVYDDNGLTVGDDFFYLSGNRVYLRKNTVPAMITPEIDIIRQDCLCYLMERYPLSNGIKKSY
jgi:succinylglutamate desuccinylase